MFCNYITAVLRPHASKFQRAACWKKVFFILLATTITGCSANSDGVFALFETDKGQVLVQLEFQKAPLTVMNFVGLAENRFEIPSVPKGTGYFNGLSFHRVVPGYIIQGGDPAGDGTGGPGYQFPNEIDASLNHDAEGILSMANSGPDTNGSQFFITVGSASSLNGAYSVFGHVVEGMDTVKKIEVGDKMNTVTILRKGDAAEAFQPSWEQFQQLKKELEMKREARIQQAKASTRAALLSFAQKQWPGIEFLKDENTLEFSIMQEGNGPTGAELATVKQYSLHYTLWAPDKKGQVVKIDSSVDRGKPSQFSPNQVIQAWGQTMPQMQIGERRIIFVPSELGYGRGGRLPLILPNSYLLFEIELLNFVR